PSRSPNWGFVLCGYRFPSIRECAHNWLDKLINFFAVETACSTVSITLATSQPCCFLFLFLRFIFPPILLFWHGADFPLVPSLFLPFPAGAGGMRNLSNWWNERR